MPGLFTGLPVASVLAGLAIPALEAAATLTLMKYQNDKAEDKINASQRILSNAQKAYCAKLKELQPLLESATDDVPKASDYTPVSIGGSYFESLKQTVQLADWAQEYAELYGSAGRDVALERARALNPLYDDQMTQIWEELGSYISGEIPQDEAVDIGGSAAETNAYNGRMGTPQLTARMMGLKTRQVKDYGRSQKRLEEAHQNQNISSTSLNPDLQKFVVNPQDRVQWDLQQAQLIQNSIQNALNLCALKDPYLLQQWQIEMDCVKSELQVAMAQASSELGFVPNYLGAFGPQIRNLFSQKGTKVEGQVDGTQFKNYDPNPFQRRASQVDQ